MSSLDDLLADLTSGDESRAEAAASALAQSGSSVFPALESLLQSSEADDRWWAVRTLAQMHKPQLEWLLTALNDRSAEVRQAVALALSAHPAEQAVPALIQSLSDEDAMVGTLAANALIAIGKPAVPALLHSFAEAPQRARIQLLRALAEIGDHRAIPLMMEALDVDSAALHYWADVGLERLGLNMVYIKPD
jgi:HEAT repeat protein